MDSSAAEQYLPPTSLWVNTYILVNTLSLTAFWMYRSNLNYYIFENGGAQFDISLAESAYFLPSLIFTLLGGVIADSTKKLFRWLIIFTLAHIAILSTMALAINLQSLSILWIVLLTFLLGTVGAIRNSPSAVFVRFISPRQNIARTNSLLSAGFNVSRIAGPMAVAALAVAMTAESIFILLPILSLPLLFFFMVLRSNEARVKGLPALKTKQNTEFRLQDLATGYGWFMIAVASFFFCSNLLWTTLPFIFADQTGIGLQLYGSAYAIFGVGAIFGSLLQPRLYRLHGISVCFLVGTLSYGSFYLLALVAPDIWILIGVSLGGAGMGLFFSSVNTHILLTAEEARQGRLLALVTILTNWLLAVGSSNLSWISSQVSIEAAFVIALFLLLGLTSFAALKLRKAE